MNYLYGRDWHPTLRKPIKEVSEKEARRQFDVKVPQLSVSAGPRLEHGQVPVYTLKIGRGGWAVDCHRYNPVGSISTVYAFREVDGRPFLDNVVIYLYPDDDRYYSQMHAKAVSMFTFRPDGWARRRFSVKDAPQAHVSEFTDVDVSAHWEDPMAFGDWDRFGAAREPALTGD